VQSKLLTLSRNAQNRAVCSGGCCGWATEADRLSALKRRDPVDAPPSDCGVREPSGVTHETLILAERELVPAAEMNYVAEIEIG